MNGTDPTRLGPEQTRLLEGSGLSPAVVELLRQLIGEAQLAGVAEPRSHELLEELIDHFRTGLEHGLDEATLIQRFGDWRQLAARFDQAALLPDEPSAPAAWRRVLGGTFIDLRHAARGLLRRPIFALGNIATLSLGIGAAVSLFALLSGVLLQPLPFRDPDRLFYLREQAADGRKLYPSYPNFEDWRRQTQLFEGVISQAWEGSATVLGADQPVRAAGVGVSRDFFELLGVRPLVGRFFTAEENAVGGPPLAVVSEEFWRRHLGARDELGAQPLVIGPEQYRVIGVLPRGFRFLTPADIYVGHERFPGTIRSAHAYQVVAKLAAGVTPERARRELDVVTAAIAAENEDNEAVATDWTPLRTRIVGSFRGAVWAMFAASILVLLVASSDVAASLLAWGRRRQDELVVRRSLGASGWRLARQQLLEAGLLSVPAMGLGVALARGAVGLVRRWGASEIPRFDNVHLDRGVLVFAVLLSLIATLSCSLLPIRQSLRSTASQRLRAGKAGLRRGRLAWGAWIGGQVAATFVLLAGAGLLVRSLDHVLSADLGFDVAGVAAAHVDLPSSKFTDPAARLAFVERLRSEVGALPGVEGTAVGNFLPFDWGNMSAPVVTEEEPDRWLAITGWRLVDPDYFRLLGVRLLSGRNLPEDGRVDGATAAVINESLARRLSPDGRAVGRRIRSNYDPRFEWLTVVGVVAEARHWRASAGDQPEVYVHYAARPETLGDEVLLLETHGSPRTLFRVVERRVRRLDADVPVRLEALSDTLRATLQRERLATGVLTVFALVVLMLSLVGIVGVVARAVAERRREVGIRLALGATPHSLVRLLQGEVLVPVALGGGAGAMLALAAARSLGSLLYDVRAADAPTYLAVSLVLVAAAFVASLWPARRVLADDPARVMRAE